METNKDLIKLEVPATSNLVQVFNQMYIDIHEGRITGMSTDQIEAIDTVIDVLVKCTRTISSARTQLYQLKLKFDTLQLEIQVPEKVEKVKKSVWSTLQHLRI